MAVRRSHCLADDGVSVAYASLGTGPRNFILVHGWCGAQALMAPLARRLGRRSRAITIDLRGHGRSGRPQTPLTAPGFVADVRAVAANAGVRRAVLVGHSMGGRVALAVAGALPALVSGLVLLDTAVIEDPAYVAARRRAIRSGQWPAALEARVEPLCAPPATSRTGNLVRGVMLRVPRPVALESLDASDSIDAPTPLAGFPGPVLYIGASQPRESASALRALKPDLEYAQVVGAGHFVHLDAAEQVEAALNRFCRLELGA